jgi:hypothetical protein
VASCRRVLAELDEADISTSGDRSLPRGTLSLTAGALSGVAEGWSRDVSEDIAGEVIERAFGADDNLSEDTKQRFIDRHVTPGEKRPPRRLCGATPRSAMHCESVLAGAARERKKPRHHRGF